MIETLNVLFRPGENGTFRLELRESYTGRIVRGSFVPPYSTKQLKVLRNRLNSQKVSTDELQEIGTTLFRALCGSEIAGAHRRDSTEQTVRDTLQGVVQRTLQRRGTVALTLSFAPGCEELVRYPWELLHNGVHFLLLTGIFTLARVLLRPEPPLRTELPVYPPLRILYISASPRGCELDTQSSFDALKVAVAEMKERGDIFLDSIPQVTFDKLVEYLNTNGGANDFNDRAVEPCYVVHFDGHGSYGRLCPNDGCELLNEATARKCVDCGTPLGRVEPQTYLCFCDAEHQSQYISTESLCTLFMSSDVRLAIFSACETAAVMDERPQSHTQTHPRSRKPAVDATLATALLKKAELDAVVAMPFLMHDDLSPTFMSHFYQALMDGRTLEEALSRARQAMLPRHHQLGWFNPVLYRYVSPGRESPVPLLAGQDAPEEHDHPLAHLGAPSVFIGREKELRDLGALFAEATERRLEAATVVQNPHRLRPGVHHLVLTGQAGMGKSALACEAVRRNKEKFPGGIIGISLQGGKSFTNALLEIAHELHVNPKSIQTANVGNRERIVLNALRSLALRGAPCLLLLDRFDEVRERSELQLWHQFLCDLPEQVLVLVTAHANPATMAVVDGMVCPWHEYHIDKMTSQDLFHLFTELAAASSLDERIHLEEPEQQAILHEICALLDGYPLGAELIFGTARSIEGTVYQPEAATRSLEEVRDELRTTHLEGIWAVLDVAYKRLSAPAQQLLPYVSVFKLPFSRDQIVTLVEPKLPAAVRAHERMEHEHYLDELHETGHEVTPSAEFIVPSELTSHWRIARDELVRASFMQFDGRLYSIHPQVRNFAFSHLPPEERRRVHRVTANYYSSLPHPSPEEWFVAFEHLAEAGEAQDLQKAVRLAVHASWALCGRGHTSALRALLERAEAFALRIGDKTGEGQIQCCLGAIFRVTGNYAEAIACLTRSYTLHTEQNDRDEAGWALYELAMLFREEGEFKQADERAKDALHLFREVGDAWGEAWMQLVLGEVSRGYGRYYEALGHFERALTSFRTLPSNYAGEEGVAMALRDRGTVHEALGEYEDALTDYAEAYRLFTALNMRFGQAWVLTDQSAVFLDQGRFKEAERTCREAMAIFREQEARRGEGWALRILGDIERKKQNRDAASSYYSEALAIFQQLSVLVEQARVSNSLGAIAFEERAHHVAKEHYEHAYTLAHGQGALQIEGRALRGLGDVARDMHDFAEARRCYQEALKIAEDLDTPAERCAVLHRLGELYTMQDEHVEALDAWVHALALDSRSEHPERTSVQKKVETLVKEHHLEEDYQKFARNHGLH
jgi:tetratricopeptide (TPR) repeat protein